MPETAVLLAVAWLVPFLVHLVPWTGMRPLGAYLLPMFWTTLLAVYFYGVRTGVIVGLFAPALNLLVTGLPSLRFISLISVELVVFALVTTWAVRRAPRFVLTAPCAYILARSVSITLEWALPVFGGVAEPLARFAHSVAGGLAGLVVLAAINVALVWHYPKRGGAAAG